MPVVRAPSADLALLAVEALIEGGIEILEITMTIPRAVEVLAELDKRFGDQILLGAGTILDESTADACIDAGARFIVSPHCDLALLSHCRGLGVATAPGALTPTEILAAWRAGADIVKIFPCEAVGGPSYVKAIKGPFPEIPLMPTGGVGLDNIRTFLSAGATAVGVGGNLVDIKLLQRNGREALVERARAFRAMTG